MTDRRDLPETNTERCLLPRPYQHGQPSGVSSQIKTRCPCFYCTRRQPHPTQTTKQRRTRDLKEQLLKLTC